MLVEPGYSGCLGTLGESVKICIHDFERAWKIFQLKALKKTHYTNLNATGTNDEILQSLSTCLNMCVQRIFLD